ncbi:MAG: hypothetical protein MZV64_27670 [Ignavibacteriales bacterium]|nr:hypothetical protein [Ignavibacteriales bacterium]
MKYLEERKNRNKIIVLAKYPRDSPLIKILIMRAVGNLENTDFVMNNTFWIGVYPGITEEMIKYTVRPKSANL